MCCGFAACRASNPRQSHHSAFLSPLVATLLGWLALGQSLAPAQIAGLVMVLASVWLSQRIMMPVRPIRPAASPEPASHPA
ncbi:hypothetical protein [Rhizobium phaseoli]|uniref:hypothetical protein n=1 Tax=Rhizobium phaseoli TaxID=396 RepID=UPI003D7C22EA